MTNDAHALIGKIYGKDVDEAAVLAATGCKTIFVVRPGSMVNVPPVAGMVTIWLGQNDVIEGVNVD